MARKGARPVEPQSTREIKQRKFSSAPKRFTERTYYNDNEIRQAESDIVSTFGIWLNEEKNCKCSILAHSPTSTRNSCHFFNKSVSKNESINDCIKSNKKAQKRPYSKNRKNRQNFQKPEISKKSPKIAKK